MPPSINPLTHYHLMQELNENRDSQDGCDNDQNYDGKSAKHTQMSFDSCLRLRINFACVWWRPVALHVCVGMYSAYGCRLDLCVVI